MKIHFVYLMFHTAELNEILFQNKVSVMGLQTAHESLEDYFKKITGGDDVD